MTEKEATMPEDDAFEVWKASVAGERVELLRKLAAASPGQQVPQEQIEQIDGALTLRLESAASVHRYLVAAKAIGKSVIPKGESTDVIEIAKFLFDVEADFRARFEEEDDDEGDGNDEDDDPLQQPPGPMNRQQRRAAERHGR